jgi:hypothetical protein
MTFIPTSICITKLSKDVPRYTVENIYTAFIRPQLEYGFLVQMYTTIVAMSRVTDWNHSDGKQPLPVVEPTTVPVIQNR